MARLPFNSGWAVRPRTSLFDEVSGARPDATPVDLPHDAMLDLERSELNGGGAESGFFVGGAVEYTKVFDVPEEYRDKRLELEFEAVFRDAQVYVNGSFVGNRPAGYSVFRVPLDGALLFGQPNTVRVEARAQHDSRWYSGLGIHRPVTLIVSDAVHIAASGIRVTTPDVEDALAVVTVSTPVVNSTPHTAIVSLKSEVHQGEEVVATDAQPVTIRPHSTAVVHQRLYVTSPKRWSVDEPNLYQLESTLADSGDIAATTFGIRTIQLDPQNGLRLNGVPTKLRGACVHHDNGILGAATFDRAEERRVEILKAAGFNAIRASHNPLSRAMLEACDRLGVLVMDEAFDVWTQTKVAFDYSIAFPDWWERDIESMVEKDFNHPSVIMYSIGNEIPDVGTPAGAALAREISEKVRTLDDTRFVSSAVNSLLVVMPQLMAMNPAGDEQNGGVNTMMSELGSVLDQINASDLVGDAIKEPHGVTDIAGMNYGDARYEVDRELNPNRIIVGSETYPPRIAHLWRLVEDNPNIIGDFTWTGWDYLGEAGLGYIGYQDESDGSRPLMGTFPALSAGSGDIDITGWRRPISYYREIVFGLRTDPYIVAQDPKNHGRTVVAGPWSWSDAEASWAWDAPAGAPVKVDVYADADEVALVLGGTEIARAAVGTEKAFVATFEVEYQPSALTAVAYRAGAEWGRSELDAAGNGAVLSAVSDREQLSSESDLAFITIDLVDELGTRLIDRAADVSVEIEGPGVLQGFGSARESTLEGFRESVHGSYNGRLLAVIRTTDPGTITVSVKADGWKSASVTLLAAESRVDAIGASR